MDLDWDQPGVANPIYHIYNYLIHTVYGNVYIIIPQNMVYNTVTLITTTTLLIYWYLFSIFTMNE